MNRTESAVFYTRERPLHDQFSPVQLVLSCPLGSASMRFASANANRLWKGIML
jgi:hypothetical protein